MKELKKIMSRKFLYPIIFTILIVVNNLLECPIPDAALALIAGTIVAFILGESYIDVTRIKNGGK